MLNQLPLRVTCSGEGSCHGRSAEVRNTVSCAGGAFVDRDFVKEGPAVVQNALSEQGSCQDMTIAEARVVDCTGSFCM